MTISRICYGAQHGSAKGCGRIIGEGEPCILFIGGQPSPSLSHVACAGLSEDIPVLTHYPCEYDNQFHLKSRLA
jgi:hypothetical protein